MVVRRLVPAVIRRRYAVKFGIALLILGLSIGAIGFVATGAITDEVEQRVQDDHEAFAEQQAGNLKLWNDQNRYTAEVIARSNVVDDDPEAIERQLYTWQTQRGSAAFEISYVEIGGDVIATTGDYDSTSDIEGVPESAYDEAEPSSTWTTDPYLAEDVTGQERAVVSYVAILPEHNDRAIVYSAELDNLLNQIGGEEETVTMVLDRNDRVMLDNAGLGGDEYDNFGATYEGDVIEKRPSTTDHHHVTGTPTGALAENYGFEANDYVVSTAKVFGSDWIVVIHEPTDEAYGYVNTVDEYGTYATLGGVLLIGLVGAVLGRNTAVSIDRLTAKARRMEEGDLDVDLETKRIDSIGRLYDGFDSMRNALREQIEEAETARQEAERERERIQRINERLERKADEYSDVMEAAADGDLTARMDADTGNEAMAEIGEDFNEMLAEIERTVAELDRFSAEVATASEEVTASSEEVRSASEQVTESVQEISEGASRQNDSLQSVNREMNGLSTTTEQIAASSNQVADVSERTARTGQSGRKAAESAVSAMTEIEEESNIAVEEIRQLEEEVEQIDDLIATISDIAQQTNMLALNANIEASRSAGNGGGGEGFSVVARQVKELSEDVEEAANAAEDRLESIHQQTLESAAEVEQTSAQVERASEEVQEAVDALEEIAEYARETNDGVQEISAATEQQAATTEEVVAMVDDAATISEETTAEAQNVAAAAEEQTTALTEVSESASDLATKASDLSTALNRFELDVENVDTPVDDPDAQAATIEADAGGAIAAEPVDGAPGTGEPEATDAAAGGDEPEVGGDEPEPKADEPGDPLGDPFADLDDDDDPLAFGPVPDEAADSESETDEGAEDDENEVFSFGSLDDESN